MAFLANIILITSILSGVLLILSVLYSSYKRLVSRYYNNFTILNWVVVVSASIFCIAISLFCFTDLHKSVSVSLIPLLHWLTAVMFIAGILLLFFSILFFILLIFGDLSDEDVLWFRVTLFIFGFGIFFLITILLLINPLNGFLLPTVQNTGLKIIGSITLFYGAFAGVVFFIGLLWRIFRGGEYVYVTTYRRISALLLGGLYIFVLAAVLLIKFNLDNYI